jgi:polyisoprenyl-teichoic acid--peptidoglycan teichoic acid transferase
MLTAFLQCDTIPDMDERYRRTRPQRRPEFDQTQPNRSYPPLAPPGSYDVTQPNMPVRQMPEPPRFPTAGQFQHYARRKKRGGCLTNLFRAALAVSLFTVLFTALSVFIYWLAPPPRTNILILGLDSREGEGVVTRTDTMILATVDPQQPYVGMLSIPRDLYLEIPGYGEERINAAHLLGEYAAEGGGIPLAKQTVEQNFAVPVNHTVRLNFQAFVSIIDAAGGIDINVEDYIIDYEYPTADYGTTIIEFQAGEQHMNGETALIYARTRHGSSDFERAERQQQVITALMKKLANPLNWWRLPAVYLAFAQNVETDMTILDVIQIAPAMLWVGPDGIDRQVLTREMAVPTTRDDGASVLMPNWPPINALTDEMFRK